MRKKLLIVSYEVPDGDIGETIKRRDAEAAEVVKSIDGAEEEGSGFGFEQRDLEYLVPEVSVVDAVAKFLAKGFSARIVGRR